MIVDECKHGMPIYKGPDGPICSCAVCEPPPKPDKKKRLSNFNNNVANFCTDETLEILKSQIVNISFQVPKWAEKDFEDDYHNAAGELPDYSSPGICLLNAKTRWDKYWYSAHIDFEYNENLKFSNEFLTRIKELDNGMLRIHSIHLAGFLLSHGFRAGWNGPK